MTEVGLSKNIYSISSEAFFGCDSLQRFTFPYTTSRLEPIIHCSKDIKNKVEEVRGAIQWKGGMLYVSASAMGIGSIFGDHTNNWNIIRNSILNIDRWVDYYEIREASTLLELALWKSNMDQAGGTTTNREACRIDVPETVKETILQYLYPSKQYLVWQDYNSEEDSDYISISNMEDDSDIDQDEMNLDTADYFDCSEIEGELDSNNELVDSDSDSDATDGF